MTAPAATTMNLLNRLPTEVCSLRFTAAPIRDDPTVMQHPHCGAGLVTGRRPWVMSPGGGSGRPPGCDPGHAIAAWCVPQAKRAVRGWAFPAISAQATRLSAGKRTLEPPMRLPWPARGPGGRRPGLRPGNCPQTATYKVLSVTTRAGRVATAWAAGRAAGPAGGGGRQRRLPPRSRGRVHDELRG